MGNFYKSIFEYLDGKYASQENKPKEEGHVLDIKGDEEFLEPITARIEVLRKYYGSR